jgi:hypothetical protein
LPLTPARPLFPALLVLRRRAAAARTAIAFANAVENFHEAEIDLALLHVDADHLHLHLVAEPVHLARVLASQHVGALDEPIVVVGHRRHVHEPLDEVLDELDEEPE